MQEVPVSPTDVVPEHMKLVASHPVSGEPVVAVAAAALTQNTQAVPLTPMPVAPAHMGIVVSHPVSGAAAVPGEAPNWTQTSQAVPAAPWLAAPKHTGVVAEHPVSGAEVVAVAVAAWTQMLHVSVLTLAVPAGLSAGHSQFLALLQNASVAQSELAAHSPAGGSMPLSSPTNSLFASLSASMMLFDMASPAPPIAVALTAVAAKPTGPAANRTGKAAAPMPPKVSHVPANCATAAGLCWGDLRIRPSRPILSDSSFLDNPPSDQ